MHIVASEHNPHIFRSWGRIPVTGTLACLFLDTRPWHGKMRCSEELVILGSGINERTRKQPAGENEGEGPGAEAFEERIQRTA